MNAGGLRPPDVRRDASPTTNMAGKEFYDFYGNALHFAAPPESQIHKSSCLIQTFTASREEVVGSEENILDLLHPSKMAVTDLVVSVVYNFLVYSATNEELGIVIVQVIV